MPRYRDVQRCTGNEMTSVEPCCFNKVTQLIEIKDWHMLTTQWIDNSWAVNIDLTLIFLLDRFVGRIIFLITDINIKCFIHAYVFILFLFALCHKTKVVFTTFIYIFCCQESLWPSCGFALVFYLCVMGLLSEKHEDNKSGKW